MEDTIFISEAVTDSLQCGGLAVLSATVDTEIFTIGNHLADDFQTLGDIYHIVLIRAASARSIESFHFLCMILIGKDNKNTLYMDN